VDESCKQVSSTVSRAGERERENKGNVGAVPHESEGGLVVVMDSKRGMRGKKEIDLRKSSQRAYGTGKRTHNYHKAEKARGRIEERRKADKKHRRG